MKVKVVIAIGQSYRRVGRYVNLSQQCKLVEVMLQLRRQQKTQWEAS